MAGAVESAREAHARALEAWRKDEAEMAAAYADWHVAPFARRHDAYAVYIAARDREEAAAAEVKRLSELVAQRQREQAIIGGAFGP